MYINKQITVGSFLPDQKASFDIVVTQHDDALPFRMVFDDGTDEEFERWLSDEDLGRMKNIINAARRARKEIV